MWKTKNSGTPKEEEDGEYWFNDNHFSDEKSLTELMVKVKSGQLLDE